MSDISTSEYFKGRAKKYNHYEKGSEANKDRSCKECVRKVFTYPWNCSEGWLNQGKGKNCINWTDNTQCLVD